MITKEIPAVHSTAITRHTPTVKRSGLQQALFPAIVGQVDVPRLLNDQPDRSDLKKTWIQNKLIHEHRE